LIEKAVKFISKLTFNVVSGMLNYILLLFIRY